MPPIIVGERPPNPPDSYYKVTFDVERVAAAKGGKQKFRFSVDIFKAANVFPAGGKFTVTRRKTTRAGQPQEITTLVSKSIPFRDKLTPEQRRKLSYRVDVLVEARVPVAHDKNDAFVLQWAPKAISDIAVPMDHLVYVHPIADV